MRGDSPLIPVESGLIVTWVPGRDATRDAGRTGRVLDGASTMPLSSPRIRDGTRRRHPPGSLTWRDSGAPDDPDGTWPQAHPVPARSTGPSVTATRREQAGRPFLTSHDSHKNPGSPRSIVTGHIAPRSSGGQRETGWKPLFRPQMTALERVSTEILR